MENHSSSLSTGSEFTEYKTGNISVQGMLLDITPIIKEDIL